MFAVLVLGAASCSTKLPMRSRRETVSFPPTQPLIRPHSLGRFFFPSAPLFSPDGILPTYLCLWYIFHVSPDPVIVSSLPNVDCGQAVWSNSASWLVNGLEKRRHPWTRLSLLRVPAPPLLLPRCRTARGELFILRATASFPLRPERLGRRFYHDHLLAFSTAVVLSAPTNLHVFRILPSRSSPLPHNRTSWPPIASLHPAGISLHRAPWENSSCRRVSLTDTCGHLQNRPFPRTLRPTCHTRSRLLRCHLQPRTWTCPCKHYKRRMKTIQTASRVRAPPPVPCLASRVDRPPSILPPPIHLVAVCLLPCPDSPARLTNSPHLER